MAYTRPTRADGAHRALRLIGYETINNLLPKEHEFCIRLEMLEVGYIGFAGL